MESSTTKTPSKIKSKFCLCFKPVTSVDDAFESATSYSSFFSSALMADCKEATSGWRRSSTKKAADDTCFWQILKKAFIDTTLLMKIKRRKAANKKKKQTSKSSSIMKLERKTDKILKEERKSNRLSSVDSSKSSLLTRSFLTSSTNSSSSSQTLGSSSPSSTNTIGFTMIKRREDVKVKDKEKGIDSDHNNMNKAFCLMMMTTSLLVLILWGKFFAIICTSFWLYLMPCRREQSDRWRPGYDEEEEFDTVEYKKKVIMEGLLGRNRSRLSMESIAKSCA